MAFDFFTDQTAWTQAHGLYTLFFEQVPQIFEIVAAVVYPALPCYSILLWMIIWRQLVDATLDNHTETIGSLQQCVEFHYAPV